VAGDNAGSALETAFQLPIGCKRPFPWQPAQTKDFVLPKIFITAVVGYAGPYSRCHPAWIFGPAQAGHQQNRGKYEDQTIRLFSHEKISFPSADRSADFAD
jgi:hypothetical protein